MRLNTKNLIIDDDDYDDDDDDEYAIYSKKNFYNLSLPSEFHPKQLPEKDANIEYIINLCNKYY